MLTLWYYTREIPVIPWYGYTVCRGVPNTNTVPVVPVTRSPRVFPYPCRTLGGAAHKLKPNRLLTVIMFGLQLRLRPYLITTSQ